MLDGWCTHSIIKNGDVSGKSFRLLLTKRNTMTWGQVCMGCTSQFESILPFATGAFRRAVIRQFSPWNISPNCDVAHSKARKSVILLSFMYHPMFQKVSRTNAELFLTFVDICAALTVKYFIFDWYDQEILRHMNTRRCAKLWATKFEWKHPCASFTPYPVTRYVSRHTLHVAYGRRAVQNR